MDAHVLIDTVGLPEMLTQEGGGTVTWVINTKVKQGNQVFY